VTDIKQEKEQLAVLENFFWQKKFSEALVLAEQLHKEFPQSFQINFIYVKILKEENKWQEAESVLKQLMSSFPDNVSILKEWADVSFNLRNLDEAEKTYNKILFLDPFNVGAKEALKKLKIMVAPTAPAAQKPAPQPEPAPSPAPEQQTAAPKKPISKGDTLPETYFEDLAIPEAQTPEAPKQEVLKPEIQDTQTEDAIVKDFFEKTDDNININLDDFYPSTEEPSTPAPAAESPQPAPTPTPDPAPIPTPSPIPSPVEPQEPSFQEMAPTPKKKTDEENDTEFATESAAQLYLSQGLYKEAISIYNKIFRLSRDERYLQKIEDVKSKMVGMKKIERLSQFLEAIKKEGVKFV
jgi:tetratricopeptide (TPR) repeat protein